MHKFAVTLMASLLSCSAAFAFWPEATDSSLEIGVGYRRDKLEWKTSSHFDSSSYSGGNFTDGYNDGYYNDGNYNDEFFVGPSRLSSRLKWKDLDIWQIELKGKYITCDNIYLRASADYGWISNGKNRDSDRASGGYNNFADDYFNNNDGGQFEFARSHSKAKGNVYDVKFAVGYQFKLCDDNFSIVPLIGYSWHGQRLKDHHLRQNFFYNDENCTNDYFTYARARSDDSSYSYFDSYSPSSYSDGNYGYSSGSYGGNHSKYHTRWNGPFIGFDMDYRFGCCCEWDFFGGYEFHWAQYHAKADWQLRCDLFDGFHHRVKDAYGHVFDIGVKWDFCECWTLALKGQFQWWCADKGRDHAKIAECHFGDVKTTCSLSIPLRDVKWESASVTLYLGMVF